MTRFFAHTRIVPCFIPAIRRENDVPRGASTSDSFAGRSFLFVKSSAKTWPARWAATEGATALPTWRNLLSKLPKKR